MGIMDTLGVGIRDVRAMGFGFALSGVRAKLGLGKLLGVRVAGGAHVYVRPHTSDFSVLRQIFREDNYRIHDSAAGRVSRRYEQILRDGGTPVIVDAGANIGASSRWFKQHYPAAAIVSIEPDAANAAMCLRNAAGLDGMHVLQAAIGGTSGFVSVLPAEEAWSVRTQRSDHGCRIVTVGDAVAGIPNGVLFIVKVDIEGFESDLFADNTGWIDEACVVYIEPHDWMLPEEKSSRAFQREFGKRDFDIYLSGENIVYVRR